MSAVKRELRAKEDLADPCMRTSGLGLGSPGTAPTALHMTPTWLRCWRLALPRCRPNWPECTLGPDRDGGRLPFAATRGAASTRGTVRFWSAGMRPRSRHTVVARPGLWPANPLPTHIKCCRAACNDDAPTSVPYILPRIWGRALLGGPRDLGIFCLVQEMA